jgi:hypothetical protein
MKAQPDVQGARARARELLAKNLDVRVIARRLNAEFHLCVYVARMTMWGCYTTVMQDKRTGDWIEKEQKVRLSW